MPTTSPAIVEFGQTMFNATGSLFGTSSIASTSISSSYTLTSSFSNRQFSWNWPTPLSRSSDGATDATEVSLIKILIPGNTMGPYDALRITSTWTYTNSATTKRPIIELSGSEFLQYSTTPSTLLLQVITLINNSGSNAQRGSSRFNAGTGTSGFDMIETAFDTTTDLPLDFRCKWDANITGSAEYIQLERFFVEVVPASLPTVISKIF